MDGIYSNLGGYMAVIGSRGSRGSGPGEDPHGLVDRECPNTVRRAAFWLNDTGLLTGKTGLAGLE